MKELVREQEGVLKQGAQNGKGNLVKMEFNGVMVAFEGKEKVNLTDLWRAAGSPELKDPNRWFTELKTAELLLALLEQKSNSTAQTYLENKPSGRDNKSNLEQWCRDVFNSTAQVGLVKTKRGKFGGTWANQIIAVSYAGYLSPKLQIWINEVFLERLQEDRNPDLIVDRSINTYRRFGLSDQRIKLRINSKLSNKAFNEVLSRHGVDKQGHAMCASNINVGVLRVQKKTYLKNNGYALTSELRNCIPDAQLTAITLAEIVSGDKINKDEINGNHDCAKISFQIAREIANTIDRIAN